MAGNPYNPNPVPRSTAAPGPPSIQIGTTSIDTLEYNGTLAIAPFKASAITIGPTASGGSVTAAPVEVRASNILVGAFAVGSWGDMVSPDDATVRYGPTSGIGGNPGAIVTPHSALRTEMKNGLIYAADGFRGIITDVDIAAGRLSISGMTGSYASATTSGPLSFRVYWNGCGFISSTSQANNIPATFAAPSVVAGQIAADSITVPDILATRAGFQYVDANLLDGTVLNIGEHDETTGVDIGFMRQSVTPLSSIDISSDTTRVMSSLDLGGFRSCFLATTGEVRLMGKVGGLTNMSGYSTANGPFVRGPMPCTWDQPTAMYQADANSTDGVTKYAAASTLGTNQLLASYPSMSKEVAYSILTLDGDAIAPGWTGTPSTVTGYDNLLTHTYFITTSGGANNSVSYTIPGSVDPGVYEVAYSVNMSGLAVTCVTEVADAVAPSTYRIMRSLTGRDISTSVVDYRDTFTVRATGAVVIRFRQVTAGNLMNIYRSLSVRQLAPLVTLIT